MHYTFIPDSEKKELRREYRIRVLIVSVFFISVAVVAGIVSLFPSYIRASIDQAYHIRDAENLKTKPDAAILSATKKDLSLSTTLITALKDSIKVNPYTEYINGIVSVKNNVKINSFSFDFSTSTVTVNIQGVAPTRDDLTSFKRNIITAIPGTNIDLPANQLAKSKNLDFSIKVVEPIK